MKDLKVYMAHELFSGGDLARDVCPALVVLHTDHADEVARIKVALEDRYDWRNRAHAAEAELAAIKRGNMGRETARKALLRAWTLGQTYWQQADSDFTSEHRKADVTEAKFRALVDETLAALPDETGGR